jgi:hypothetical protein
MHPDLKRLSDAADGLLFLSETDAPFHVIECSDASTAPEEWVSLLSGGASPVEIQEVDYFFRNQVRVHDASTTEKEARVYRTGSIQVDAFIIGRLADGTLGGLKTNLVET